MSVKIIYKDVPTGADKDATITTTPQTGFSTPSALPFGVETGAIITTELNNWGLTQELKARGTQPFAFWSENISNSECVFDSSPQIVIDFDEKYTATGLSFRFSPTTNDYCNQITVVWYQDGVEKVRGTYYPTSPVYILENTVEGFDKIEIYFEKTSLPHRRAKVEYIGIGVVREYSGTEIMDIKIINEIDLISDTVPVNVLDVSFHSNTDADLMFQKKQPVEAYNDNDPIGFYYVEKGERVSSQNYTLNCQSAIGVLDLDEYDGGMWRTETPIETLIEDVLGGMFEYKLEEALQGKTLKGYIPPEITRREALQHIAFALGACVSTTGANTIKIFLPPTSEGITIPPEETYQGGKVTTSDMVTRVYVVGYDIYTGEPVDGQDSLEFNGEQYALETYLFGADNPDAGVDTLPNTIKYDGCYLITSTTAQERANALMEYHRRRNVYSAKHIVSGQAVGDRATVTTPWNDTKKANVVKMTLTVSGIVASDTEFLLD